MTGRVWLVYELGTDGIHVACACLTEADARAVAAKVNATGNRDVDVDAIPVYGDTVEGIVVLHLKETLMDDGRTFGPWEETATYWPWDRITAPECKAWWARRAVMAHDGGALTVLGTDHERVRRTFAAKRAELLANPAIAAQEDISA